MSRGAEDYLNLLSHPHAISLNPYIKSVEFAKIYAHVTPAGMDGLHTVEMFDPGTPLDEQAMRARKLCIERKYYGFELYRRRIGTKRQVKTRDFEIVGINW